MNKDLLKEELSKHIVEVEATGTAAREFIRIFVETKRELRAKSTLVEELSKRAEAMAGAQRHLSEKLSNTGSQCDELRAQLRAEVTLKESLQDINLKLKAEIEDLKALYLESRHIIASQQNEKRRYEEAIALAGSLVEYHGAERARVVSAIESRELLLTEASRVIDVLRGRVAKRGKVWRLLGLAR